MGEVVEEAKLRDKHRAHPQPVGLAFPALGGPRRARQRELPASKPDSGMKSAGRTESSRAASWPSRPTRARNNAEIEAMAKA
jgi:hypothetical protein